MKSEGALLAGEMSGHMFFNDRYYGYDDAIYAAARLLEIVAREKKSPGDLLADLPKTVCTPELRVDCPDEVKFKVVDRVKERLMSMGHEVNAIDGARVEFGDAWGLVRASNTQPVLVFRFEAPNQTRLDEIRRLIEKTVQDEIRKIG
jgi:phosphomannomutase/phosphoglucomutase